MGEYDEERERLSWREIDRLRDRSKHVRKEEKRERPQKLDRWKTKRAKEALERLLKGEKGTLEHDKLYNKIHASYGTESFLKNVKAYIDKYGLPDDASTLMLIMDTKDEKIILAALEKLKSMYHHLPERTKEDVRRKVSILRFTEKSTEVREEALAFLEELKGP
ncbi:MAG: hypothetical protein NZ583_04170 [Desulfobacterota bacterium]|nr:hypothetical protein [Thermodesulfobacteriota bacterium]MDW8001535.1 hypothetical protein [Deltaproteobacteria bacterium]